MAKKNTPDESNIINVDEVYTKTEQFVDKNRLALTFGIGGLAALILGVLGYQSFIVAPANAHAEESAWRAESYFEMDSMEWAIFGDGYAAGLEEILNEYNGTSAGSRAAYRLGVYHRDAGSYEEAIAAFESVELSDDVIGILTTGNIGDCEVELGNYEAAIGHFEAAAHAASSELSDAILTPMFLFKAAISQIEIGNNKAAKNNLDQIVSDYPKSQQFSAASGMAATLIES